MLKKYNIQLSKADKENLKKYIPPLVVIVLSAIVVVVMLLVNDIKDTFTNKNMKIVFVIANYVFSTTIYITMCLVMKYPIEKDFEQKFKKKLLEQDKKTLMKMKNSLGVRARIIAFIILLPIIQFGQLRYMIRTVVRNDNGTQHIIGLGHIFSIIIILFSLLVIYIYCALYIKMQNRKFIKNNDVTRDI